MRFRLGPRPDVAPGATFDRLRVLDHVVVTDAEGQRRTLCEVQCGCGTVFQVRPESLRSRQTRSCGCLHRDQSAERLRRMWATAKQVAAEEVACPSM